MNRDRRFARIEFGPLEGGNAAAKMLPFEIPEDRGCRYMVRAIEREPDEACVPGWPWAFVGVPMRTLPLGWVARLN
ncbi:hypothetical protein GCM10027081_42650 [Cupriavidus yeoncheonensis]